MHRFCFWKYWQKNKTISIHFDQLKKYLCNIKLTSSTDEVNSAPFLHNTKQGSSIYKQYISNSISGSSKLHFVHSVIIHNVNTLIRKRCQKWTYDSSCQTQLIICLIKKTADKAGGIYSYIFCLVINLKIPSIATLAINMMNGLPIFKETKKKKNLDLPICNLVKQNFDRSGLSNKS